MRRFMSSVVVGLIVSLSFSGVSAAEEESDVVVTDADFKAWMKLEYEYNLRNARIDYDSANESKHEAAWQQALRASGMTEERREDIDRALSTIVDALEGADDGSVSKDDLDSYLKDFKPATVATARRHRAELRGDRGQAKADAQAQKEFRDARRGAQVKAADIQGKWVVDAEATMRAMLGGMADAPGMEAVKKDLEKTLEGNSYEFKGDQVIATGVSNGKKSVSRGTFRIEGNDLVVDGVGSSLEIGMKDGRLVLGVGVAAVSYKRE